MYYRYIDWWLKWKTEAVKRDVEAIYSKINSIKSSVNLLGAYGHITT